MKRYDELLKRLELAARSFTFDPSYVPLEAAVLRDAKAAIRELLASAEKAEAAEAQMREVLLPFAEVAKAMSEHDCGPVLAIRDLCYGMDKQEPWFAALAALAAKEKP